MKNKYIKYDWFLLIKYNRKLVGIKRPHSVMQDNNSGSSEDGANFLNGDDSCSLSEGNEGYVP